MKKPLSFVGRCMAIGLLITLIACDQAIDPYAPESRCAPGCTGSTVCEMDIQRVSANSNCGSPPVDCGAFDASAQGCGPSGHPCILGASCVQMPNCSSDDCNCVLAAICDTYTPAPYGVCNRTSSGGIDFYCYQS